MNNKRSFDVISVQIVLYVLFVIISLSAILSIDNYMHRRMMYINSLFLNETSKIHLNDILKSKISDAHSTLLSYTHALSFNEMDKLEKKRMSKDVEEISKLLFILEQGGTYIDSVDVKYDKQSKITFNIDYINHNKGKYNIQVLDLRAKLIEIEHFIDEFRNLVIDGILAFQSNSVDRVMAATRQRSFAVKSLASFFTRVNESSNRMYKEAGDSEKRIKAYIDATATKFRSTKLKMNAILAFFAYRFGYPNVLSGVQSC